MEFWQRLLEGMEGEMDVVKSYAEEDDDEVSLACRTAVQSYIPNTCTNSNTHAHITHSGWAGGTRLALFLLWRVKF